MFCNRLLQTAVTIDSFREGGEIGACNVLGIRDKPMTVRIFPASSLFLFIKEADRAAVICCRFVF